MSRLGDGDGVGDDDEEEDEEVLWIRYRDAVWANLCSDHVEECNKKETQR